MSAEEYYCPACMVERADAEPTHGGLQYLDTCPNCSSEDIPLLRPDDGECGSCGVYLSQYPCHRCGYDGLGRADFTPTPRELAKGYFAPRPDA